MIGTKGQLAEALGRLGSSLYELITIGRGCIDLLDERSVLEAIREASPQIVINAAAYTAVDKAETHIAQARAINATAVGHLSRAATAVRAAFVHVSTDFVFDGESSRPYTTEAKPNPINVYGQTKLEGELQAGYSSLIVRTSWLYSHSDYNFVSTVLRLLQKDRLARVVTDQVGTPTDVEGLARGILALAADGATGIYHYTDSGVASWYDFAVSVREEGIKHCLVSRDSAVIPISSTEYPTPARRPFYSVLDKSRTIAALGTAAPHWRESLARVIEGRARG